MCFESRRRPEEVEATRPTSEEIRELFERYRGPEVMAPAPPEPPEEPEQHREFVLSER